MHRSIPFGGVRICGAWAPRAFLLCINSKYTRPPPDSRGSEHHQHGKSSNLGFTLNVFVLCGRGLAAVEGHGVFIAHAGAAKYIQRGSDG